MPDNLTRFTKRARNVMSLAQEEAQRLNHNYIGTEHLLLGLIDDEDGLAAKVLHELHIDFDALRQAVITAVGVGERKPHGTPALAPSAMHVFELAISIAGQLGHRYIGTEHLLLGLLEEGAGVGVQALRQFVTVGAVADKMVAAMTHASIDDADMRARMQTAVSTLTNYLTARESVIEWLKAPPGQWNRQVYEAAVQEERSRLARDLHDSIKQQLFAISVSAAAAQERLDTDQPGTRAALADIQRSAQAAMVEMNAMLHQLSPTPLATAGLIDALREQAEALSYRTGAEVTTAFGELPPADQLPLGAQETLFRIAQEAMSNVARHARAHQVHLRLEQLENPPRVQLELRDDGQGFDPTKTPSGMGLANIHERALRLNGKVAITSAPGQGAMLRVEIPLLEGAPYA
jgi:signal transduction histidine kinase